MPLIDYDYFKSRRVQGAGDFPTTIDSTHLVDAELIMRQIAGNAYEESILINDKAEEDRTNDEKRQLTAFKNAESEILFALLLPDLNTRLNQLGLVQSAFSQNFGTGTFRIASPSELIKIIDIYVQRAKLLIREYLPKSYGVTPVACISEE